MTDKKFVDDEEIIKALECCVSTTTDEACDGCPFNKQNLCDKDQLALEKYALNLINHQKAEIEKLKAENQILYRNADTALQDDLNERRELFEPEIKAEAYKKFAERIKLSIKANVVETLCNDIKGVYKAEYVLDDIDNLLKEMVGEEE